MKKYSVQLVIIVFIIFALAGISERTASAYKIKIKTEKNGPYAEKMGDEMFDVAKEGVCYSFKSYWKRVKKIGADNVMPVFVGKEPTKKDTFTLCKPYVIWRDSESHSLFPQYYFPVTVKGQITTLVQVYGRMEEPEHAGADIVYMDYEEYEQEIEGLNRLDYLHKDYVFFLHGGTTMAQGEDGKIEKLFDDADNYREPTDGEEFFYSLAYEKKLELTIAQMDDYMTYEELMAFSEEHFDPNPTIGGTDSSKEAAPAPQRTTSTPEPDTSAEETPDNSYSLLPVVAMAVIVTILLIILVIVRIKKRRDK